MGKSGYVDAVTEKKVSNILMIAEIPKVINGKRKNINLEMRHRYVFNRKEINSTELEDTKEYLHKVDDLSAYTTELIDLKMRSISKTTCDREFCCKFKLELDFDEKILKNTTKYYRCVQNSFI